MAARREGAGGGDDDMMEAIKESKRLAVLENVSVMAEDIHELVNLGSV